MMPAACVLHVYNACMNASTLSLDAALNADLHCHSTVSDGTQSPEWLAQRAADNGVRLWALTDHDEVAGCARAAAAAAALQLPFLAGVEISITYIDKTVHIVGLGVDPEHPGLVEGLRRTRGGRDERAREIAQQLAEAGIPGAYEGALKFVGNPDLISRSHFARFLVEAGACADVPEVFRHYLTEGKPGFVPHRWASLEQAVQWITGAGGVAIIAHPARYDFTPQEEHILFSRFKELGGQGVEVMTSSHSEAEVQKYAQMARDYRLYASRGSDFHSPGESRIDLGTLPALPGGLQPVWQLLGKRIRYPHTASTGA